MKNQREVTLRIRLAAIAILGLFIILAAAAYLSGRQVDLNSQLLDKDAVPGTIGAHHLRMAMSRSIGWVMVAASAQTPQSRDASLQVVHDADLAFAEALKEYEATMKIAPAEDRALLARVKSGYVEYHKKLMAYEALILAGNHEVTAAFLEHDLVPAYLPVVKSAEDLLRYNHANSILFANIIRSSVHRLYWTVAIVMVLALAGVAVLFGNLTIRRRELKELRENEEKYSKAFLANPSGIAITDIETGRYIEVNESFCKILGYPQQEVIGYTILDKGIWSSAEERSRILQPLLAGGTLHTQEIQMRTRYGVRKTVSLNAELIELRGQKCIMTLIEDVTERRQLEQKQAQLAAIVESSEDAIIGKTLAGIITTWNRGAEKIFGYTAAEAIGQPLQMLLPPAHQHEEDGILARIARGETIQHFDTMRVRKDGREICISATISPLRDANGKVTGASKIARDITAQRQADEALRESEARIRILGDNLPSGMMYQLDMGADAQKRQFTYISAGVEKLHGITAEAAMQDAQKLYGQIVEADRPLIAAREAAALAGMKPFMAELRFQLPSGGIRWSLLASAPRRMANGHVLWDGIEFDITAQKRAEEVLREKQAQLLLAMDIAKLADWEFDVVGNTLTADEHMFHLFGTTSAQEGGLSMSPEEYIRRFVHPADVGIVASEVAIGIAATDPNFARQFEYRIIRKDGMERVILVRSRIIMDEMGRTGKIRGTNQDITEQKQAELRIRQFNRLYAVLSDINKAIVREKDPQRMLLDACQIAVEKGQFRMAWVGMQDPETQIVRPVASAGMVDGFLNLSTFDLRDQSKCGGPSGRCFLSGEPVTSGDMAHDPLLAPWREEVLKRGYRSGASFPLKVGGKVVGIFTLYSIQVGFFNEEEMLLLDELARDLGFALEVSQGEAKRRQTEQELRWRTAFFEAQVHSAIDGILVVDSSGKKLLQNQRMNALWKIPPSIADDPDDSRQVQFVLGRVKEPKVFAQRVSELNAQPDEVSIDEVELVDGTLMERYSAPVLGSDGTYYGRVWTFHDVTDTRQKEIRFRRLFESNMQGVFFWKADGTILEANEAFLQFLGYTRADLTAGLVNWRALTPPEYALQDASALEQISAHGICVPYEKEYLRKDGKRLPILIGAAVFEGSQEGVCFVLDLSERHRLEAQFLRAQRMEGMGTLASGVAHDLNNILTPIMMSMTMLRMKMSDEMRENLFDTIEASAARGAQIVKQVLAFGRGLDGEKHPLQLEMLIHEMEQMIRSTFPKDIVVESVIDPRLWPVLGDATQLHQVLLNLCVNARDAMPNGGTLRLSATNLNIDVSYASMLSEISPGSHVLLEVADSGAGISPEIMERIFDPFFTTKSVGKGSGLGLSTVHGIIKTHGGLLKVTSEPDQGTTFRIYLPAAPDQVAVADIASSTPPPIGKGELVLVVDDEQSIADSARWVLESHGYRVLLASDGAEALSVFSKNDDIAAVLTDVMMPVLNGVLFLRTLRKMSQDIPVIGSTGLAEKSQIDELKALHVEPILRKPYNAGTLLHTLHGVLHPHP